VHELDRGATGDSTFTLTIVQRRGQEDEERAQSLASGSVSAAMSPRRPGYAATDSSRRRSSSVR
jgi:hypothetical protein